MFQLGEMTQPHGDYEVGAGTSIPSAKWFVSGYGGDVVSALQLGVRAMATGLALGAES